jgi:hypothetical protein
VSEEERPVKSMVALRALLQRSANTIKRPAAGCGPLLYSRVLPQPVHENQDMHPDTPESSHMHGNETLRCVSLTGTVGQAVVRLLRYELLFSGVNNSNEQCVNTMKNIRNKFRVILIGNFAAFGLRTAELFRDRSDIIMLTSVTITMSRTSHIVDGCRSQAHAHV